MIKLYGTTLRFYRGAGIRSHIKQDHLYYLNKSHNLDIILLSEVKLIR